MKRFDLCFTILSESRARIIGGSDIHVQSGNLHALLSTILYTPHLLKHNVAQTHHYKLQCWVTRFANFKPSEGCPINNNNCLTVIR